MADKEAQTGVAEEAFAACKGEEWLHFGDGGQCLTVKAARPWIGDDGTGTQFMATLAENYICAAVAATGDEEVGEVLLCIPSDVVEEGDLPLSPIGATPSCSVTGNMGDPVGVSFLVWDSEILADGNLSLLPQTLPRPGALRYFGPREAEWPSGTELLAVMREKGYLAPVNLDDEGDGALGYVSAASATQALPGGSGEDSAGNADDDEEVVAARDRLR